MEYCRDEGLRKYWNEWSYPYHKEGDGPLYRGKPATEYNHNMDQFAIEMVRRWYDYWCERPGTGTRVSSGGVKIVFSDTNTHHRGESNYRTSGVVDAMRIPKDAFYAHQMMWDGWVSPEKERTHIIGHWNYDDAPSSESGEGGVKPVEKPVYVVSTADEVELFINGVSQGIRKKSNHNYPLSAISYPLCTEYHVGWRVTFDPGEVKAVSRKDGKVVCSQTIRTAGAPAKIRLSKDYVGRETTFISVEVVDKDGNLCPWAEDLIYFISEGDCTVLATDNGCQTSMERMRVVATPSNPYPSAQRKAFFGKEFTDRRGLICIDLASESMKKNLVSHRYPFVKLMNLLYPFPVFFQ
jgi:hypothetical protein